LGAGLTIQPCKKVIVTKPQKRGGGVEPYDDDDDDDDEGYNCKNILYWKTKNN
jgi:hypothetical protein